MGRQRRANSGALNTMETVKSVDILRDQHSGRKVRRARRIGHWCRSLGYWILKLHREAVSDDKREAVASEVGPGERTPGLREQRREGTGCWGSAA